MFLVLEKPTTDPLTWLYYKNDERVAHRKFQTQEGQNTCIRPAEKHMYIYIYIWTLGLALH